MTEVPPPRLAHELWAMKLERDRQKSDNQNKDHEISQNFDH